MEQLGNPSITATLTTHGKVLPSDMDDLADRLEQRHRARNRAH